MRRLSRMGAWLIALLIMSPSASAEPSKPLTLEDCYTMALKQSEEIALRSERITETEGRFLQALSGMLPRLSFSSIDKRQDGNGNSPFTRKSLPERKFVFSQPLFSGFKEFAAMKGSKLEKHQREQEKKRAEQLLLVDVSDAFYLLLEQREQLDILNAIRQTLKERIRELQERENLGRSRVSEVVAAQAQLHRAEAEWETIQNQETVVAQLLQFLTGLDAIGELQKPGPDLPAAPPRDAYLSRANSRPDVKAAEEAVKIAQQQKAVARAKYFPTVNANGNYYTERSGAAEDVKWDASLNVNVPLFQGGEALGANKETASELRQAEITLGRTRRSALQDIRDSHTQYEGSLNRLRALREALESTDETYQYEVKEYRLNLVNNLEVLAALQTLQDSRREVIQIMYEARRLYWKLQAAAGYSLEEKSK